MHVLNEGLLTAHLLHEGIPGDPLGLHLPTARPDHDESPRPAEGERSRSPLLAVHAGPSCRGLPSYTNLITSIFMIVHLHVESSLTD